MWDNYVFSRHCLFLVEFWGVCQKPQGKIIPPLVTFIFPGYRVNDDPNMLFQQMEIFYEMTSQFPKEYAYVASLPRVSDAIFSM